MLGRLFCKTYVELQDDSKYADAYAVCYDIVEHFLYQKGDRIISTVDTDARVAYKTPGKAKKGYKNHIIMDEDSEIIVGSIQTPFNVGDQKELLPLLEQVESTYDLKPKEISADKAYGTIKIRSELKDKEIISNINFYEERSNQEAESGYTPKDFVFSEENQSMTCPNGIVTTEYKEVIIKESEDGLPYRDYMFDKKNCSCCPLREKCIGKTTKSGKPSKRSKRVRVSSRYDAILRDRKRTNTSEFKEAMNMRYKIERRFATQAMHRGGRRSRYIGMKRTRIQIHLVNTVTNIIRALNIINALNLSTS